MRNCLARIATEQLVLRRNLNARRSGEKRHWSMAAKEVTEKITRIGALLPAASSKWHERPEFLYTYRLPSANTLIVCSAQTILSRSSTSPCPSALFNLTDAAVPRC